MAITFFVVLLVTLVSSCAMGQQIAGPQPPPPPPPPNSGEDLILHLAGPIMEFYMKDPVTSKDSSCFGKIGDQQMIEFVVDVAASPAADPEDQRLSANPIQRLVGGPLKDPSTAYFDSIEMLINDVSIGMKPESTCVVILDNGQKYYIRGRPVNASAVTQDQVQDATGKFKTLNPKLTNYTDGGPYASVWTNNLARMTRLALEARDNGVPVVLMGKPEQQYQTPFRVVITDGSSGATINDYTDDPQRTYLIDVGGRRFLSKLSFQQAVTLAAVADADCLLKVNLLPRSIRYLACLALSAPAGPAQQASPQPLKVFSDAATTVAPCLAKALGDAVTAPPNIPEVQPPPPRQQPQVAPQQPLPQPPPQQAPQQQAAFPCQPPAHPAAPLTPCQQKALAQAQTSKV